MLKEKLIIDIFIYIWCRTNNFEKKKPHITLTKTLLTKNPP